jgi:VCBS repeat protein/FG-GAP repeat protein
MKIFRLFLGVLLAAFAVSACDCNGAKNECDCVPVIEITQPGSTVLTEFHDTDMVDLGIQYPASIRTACIPEGTVLNFSNDRRPGETIQGNVVIDDVANQAGHIDFGNQTFEDGTNQVCARGGVSVINDSDGSMSCSPVLKTAEDCIDVTVQTGIPACRFDDPTDGALLTADDDSSAAEGFQHDVLVTCKGVNDGEAIVLLVNGNQIASGNMSNSQFQLDDVDLPVGSLVLRVETTGTGNEDVATEISITIDNGDCAVRLLPATGSTFTAADDEDTNTDGLQVTLTVETDTSGTFACAAGSPVTLYVGSDTYQSTLTGNTAAIIVDLVDGTVQAYAEITEAGAGTSQSLTNEYFVCASPIVVDIESPSHGITITDAADQDPDTGGIQVAVSGTSSGVPAAENLRVLVDDSVVLDGTEPLRPATFYAGGSYSFEFISFSLSGQHNIQVIGVDACGAEAPSSIHVVQVQTEQRTCLITDPAANDVLLVVDDKDSDENNDLQYDVSITTGNVPDGTTFTLQIGGGQAALEGLTVNSNQWTGEVTFTDGDKNLRCVLESEEMSPLVPITVDGHSPTVDITSPLDNDVFDQTDVNVCVATSGVDDGLMATINISDGTNSTDFTCTVSDNACCTSVTLYQGTNTITATVTDMPAGAGNPASDAISVNAVICTAAPVCTIVDPSDDIPLAGPYTVIIECTEILDPAGIWLVVVSNGVPGQAMNPTTWEAGTGTARFEVNFSNGNVVLQVAATNSCGTSNESFAFFVGPVDAPTITITTPITGACSEAASVQVEAATTNVAQGVTCYFCMRETAATQVPECTSALSAASGQVDASGVCQVDLILPFESDWQVWGSVTNTVPLTSTSPAVEVKYDETDPVVAFVQPTDATIYNAASLDADLAEPGFQIEVVISADVEDGLAIDYLRVDGVGATIVGAPVFAAGQITLLVTLDDGSFSLTARACDCAGNCGVAAPVGIVIDREAPSVTISEPPDSFQYGETDDANPVQPGFQHDVVLQFVGAAAGDEVCIDSSQSSDDPCHILVAGETDTYTFAAATLMDDGIPGANVQLSADISDPAGNLGQDSISGSINLLAPDVTITRPEHLDELGLAADMCGPVGFQTQVDIETENTDVGDLLVLCICNGPCPAPAPGDRCELQGYGHEIWVGTVTDLTTFVACVEFAEGANTLRAYAENMPGQGTWSDPIDVSVDITPPTVDTLVTNAGPDNCLNAGDGNFVATVGVSDGGPSDLVGSSVVLNRDWPPGTPLPGCNAAVAGGQAVINCALGDGLYDITAVFADSYGNPNVKESNPVINDPEALALITVDTLAPSISVTDPDPTPVTPFNHDDDLNGGTQAADFNFCVSTDAEEGQTVNFYIDGSPEGATATVLANGTACIQTTMGQGSHALTAMVEDLCGNQTTSAALNIDVDTIVPTVTCSAPITGSTHATQDVSFTCNPSEAGEISIDSNLGDNCLHTAGSAGDTTFDCSLGEGTHDFTITVTDQAGNLSAPATIDNVTVSVDGCQIAFNDPTPSVLNAADDDGNPDNGISIDLTACSSDCNSSCALCSVTIWVDGAQQGGAQPFDVGGCVDFNGVVLPHKDDADTVVRVEVDDGADVTFDQFNVLVDLRVPVIELLVPSGPAADCVTADNPRVDGLTVIADEDPAAPFDCDMDFLIRVTDGGNATNGGTLTLEDGAPISTDNVDASPDDVSLANVALAHDDSTALTVRVVDAAGNETTTPVTITADVVAPGAADLSSSSVTDSRRAYVSAMWAATGDDGSVGSAAAYNFKWSLSDIDSTNWDSANLIYSGSNQSWPGSTGPALPPLNTYHLAVRAEDEQGNLGPVSADHSLANNWNEHSYSVTTAGGYFAYDLWNIGDVDHDGLPDLAVAADTEGAGSEGALYVFYGTADLTDWNDSDAPPLILTRSLASESFGSDVGVIGNIDGTENCDGDPVAAIDDLVVTGRGYDSSRGRVSVFFGTCQTDLTSVPNIEIRGDNQGDYFAYFTEIVGDINGDGFDDLVITAPTAWLVDDYYGVAYIFYGRSRAEWTALAGDGILYAAEADLKIVGNSTNHWDPDPAYYNDWFGYYHGITTLGDLDGGADGNSAADFAVGASTINTEYLFDGEDMLAIAGGTQTAYVGSDAMTTLNEGPEIYTDATWAYVGFGNQAVGGIDLVGDSKLDLVVAAARYNRVYVYPGVDGPGDPAVVIDGTPVETIQLTGNTAWFGWDLDVADINLDNEPDLMMGTNTSDGHRAFLYLNNGSSPYFPGSPSATLTNAGQSDYYGISIAIGDFNGDNRPDIVVGSQEGNGMFYVRY